RGEQRARAFLAGITVLASNDACLQVRAVLGPLSLHFRLEERAIAIERAIDHASQQSFLGREVIEQAALADACLLGNEIEREIGDAALSCDVIGGFEDAFAK